MTNVVKVPQRECEGFQKVGEETLPASMLRFINTQYFQIMNNHGGYVEFQSRNTRHCWIIKPCPGKRFFYRIYHKHRRDVPYYHKHWQTNTFKMALKAIQSHDDYVLKRQTAASGTI